MKRISILWLSLLLLMVAGCGNNKENNDTIVYPKLLLGDWSAAHFSDNAVVTTEMWDFSFKADGTGSLFTRQFRYELKGNHIFLHYIVEDNYYGQTEFEYIIKSLSTDLMEWEEVANGNWGNNTYHLKFYRMNKNNI